MVTCTVVLMVTIVGIFFSTNDRVLVKEALFKLKKEADLELEDSGFLMCDFALILHKNISTAPYFFRGSVIVSKINFIIKENLSHYIAVDTFVED